MQHLHYLVSYNYKPTKSLQNLLSFSFLSLSSSHLSFLSLIQIIVGFLLLLVPAEAVFLLIFITPPLQSVRVSHMVGVVAMTTGSALNWPVWKHVVSIPFHIQVHASEKREFSPSDF